MGTRIITIARFCVDINFKWTNHLRTRFYTTCLTTHHHVTLPTNLMSAVIASPCYVDISLSVNIIPKPKNKNNLLLHFAPSSPTSLQCTHCISNATNTPSQHWHSVSKHIIEHITHTGSNPNRYSSFSSSNCLQ